MDKSAIGFEYEWMADGSLRLRFLGREGQIVGQQVVAEEGLVPLQTLVGFAFVARCCSPEVLLEACADGARARCETGGDAGGSGRVRATLASDGGVDLEAVEGGGVLRGRGRSSKGDIEVPFLHLTIERRTTASRPRQSGDGCRPS